MFSVIQSGVGQNIAMHASPTARHSTFLMCAFPVHSTLFFPSSLPVIKQSVTWTVNYGFSP